jgi:hypothetical protein
MKTARVSSTSDRVRQHAVDTYLFPARRRRDKTVSINVGAVHKALRLANRVPLVCTALESKKFQTENQLNLVAKTGPESGQSTTVTYTYEFVDTSKEPNKDTDRQDAWNRLRGALKDVFAEYGGGEAYLRAERASFRDTSDREK